MYFFMGGLTKDSNTTNASLTMMLISLMLILTKIAIKLQQDPYIFQILILQNININILSKI